VADAPDTILRAITEDGAFRVITARTRATVRGAVGAQRATGAIDPGRVAPAVVRTFADMVTATILLRETMAPEQRVQGILQGRDGKGRMVVDSHPDGSTRGLLQLGKGASVVLGGGRLQMMRTLFSGQLHQGIVEVPDQGGVSGALMQYLQTSEQVVSMCAVGCVLDGHDVREAGGYLVQLLPEVGEAPLAIMTERLRDFQDIEPLLRNGTAEPKALLDELLFRMPYGVVGDATVRFECGCSATRVTASLATLPREDIESFLADGKVLEITCDYCGREYAIAPEQLRGLVARN
jgi:molecular chaperone Hsp33